MFFKSEETVKYVLSNTGARIVFSWTRRSQSVVGVLLLYEVQGDTSGRWTDEAVKSRRHDSKRT